MNYNYLCRKYPMGTPIRMGAAYGKVMGYDTKDDKATGTLKVAFDCEPQSIVTIEPYDMMLIEKAEQGDRLAAEVLRPPILLPSEMPKVEEDQETNRDAIYEGLPMKEVLALLPTNATRIRYMHRKGYSNSAIKCWLKVSYHVIWNTIHVNAPDYVPAIISHLPNGFRGYRLTKRSKYGYMTCRECRLVFRIDYIYRMPMKDNPKVRLNCCPMCGECDYVVPFEDKLALVPVKLTKRQKKFRIGDTYL